MEEIERGFDRVRWDHRKMNTYGFPPERGPQYFLWNSFISCVLFPYLFSTRVDPWPLPMPSDILSFRRPPLARWSAFEPLYTPLYEFLETHYQTIRPTLQRWCTDPSSLQTLRNGNDLCVPGTALQHELPKVLALLDTAYEGVQQWAMTSLGPAPTQHADRHQHHRLRDSFWNTLVFGQTVRHWMEQPLLHSLDHCIDHLQPAPTSPIDLNPRLRAYVKQGIRKMATCETFREWLARMGDSDWLVKMVVQTKLNKMSNSEIWSKREVYYEAIRSLLVVPHALVQTVRAEVRAQREVDEAETALVKSDPRERKRLAYDRMPVRHRPHRPHRNSSRHRRNPSSSRHAARVAAYQRARRALQRAEHNTERWIGWWRKRAQEAQKAAEGTASPSGTSSTSSSSWWSRITRRFTRTTNTTVTRSHSSLPTKHHHSSTPTKHPPFYLLSVTPFHLLYAALSPLHLYHHQWSTHPLFPVIVYHLQTIDALVPVVYVPQHPDDDRYCRHIKDVPVFGYTRRARACQARSRALRDVYCAVSYTMRNEAVMPRQTMMRMKGCERCADVEACIERDRVNFKGLRRTCRRSHQGTSRTSRKNRSSRRRRK